MQNECFVCGGCNFTINDGAFVCNECGIQSQSFREEQISYHNNILTNVYDDRFDKEHEVTAGSQLDKVTKLLSWECLNLILLGLTNEMIELGAKPSLKVIVLQLWVRYLQCIEAAFTSKKFKKLPKLNATINNVDCEILYGVENIRRKLLNAKTGIHKDFVRINKHKQKRQNKSLTSDNSSVASTLTVNQKRSRRNRKIRRLNKSTKDSNNDSAGLSDDVSLLQRSVKSGKVKVKLTKTIKKSLISMPLKTTNLSVEESSNLIKSGRKSWINLKSKEKKNSLTIRKVVSIIQLALMINNDDIYSSDIIRWIHEGHFHVNRINIFLPENVLHGLNLRGMINHMSSKSLNMELFMLLNHFGVNQLPDVDFTKIVIRFCDELQLPSDFTHFVNKLLLILPPNLKFKKIKPDIEVNSMAYILFVAKFLFILDGNAENLSSDFAEKVNQSKEFDKQLFNWNDYMQYIECRNSIVSQYNYLLHKDLYGNHIRNTQLFINDWNIMKSTLSTNKIGQLSKDLRENTEILLKSLPDVETKESYREIPASTKPLSSILKWIFEYHSTEISVEAKRILEKNFTETDILYLTDENRIHDLADECNIPIQVNCNLPTHYSKQDIIKLNPQYKSTTKTRVRLIDQPITKELQNETPNESYKQIPNTIFLGTGKHYWHLYLRKRYLNRTSINIVNKYLKKQFPFSFQWFMSQCCNIVKCQPLRMYLDLMDLEIKLSKLVTDENICDQTTEYDDMFSNLTL